MQPSSCCGFTSPVPPTGFSSSVSLGSSEFHHIALFRSYQEAKSFCRQTFTDLATVHNSDDMDRLITSVPASTARAWIGLERSDTWTWNWVWPHQELDYQNWREGEPLGENEDACAAMDPQGQWFHSDCTTRRSFVCHSEYTWNQVDLGFVPPLVYPSAPASLCVSITVHCFTPPGRVLSLCVSFSFHLHCSELLMWLLFLLKKSLC